MRPAGSKPGNPKSARRFAMLRDNAMIVRLSISTWTARKFDKGVTAKVNSDYAVSESAGRYNKVLIAKEAIQEITRAVSAARTFHYVNTLPWDDGGGRILPSKNFLTYSKKMRELKELYEKAVRDFLANYDEYRNDSAVKLGKMFNPADYPGKKEIEHKFGFGTDIEPVPSAEDFRVDVSSSDSVKIKKELEARVKDRVVEATKDLYVRLNDVVGKFADKLADKDAIFRDSLIENVVELVNLLPKLNVADDPDLDKLCKETQKKLCAMEPETLRNDPKVRTKATGDAQAILNKMSAYLGKH